MSPSRVCAVDTLDLAKGQQSTFGFMEQENVARVERQRGVSITVVIGNPPYNAWQLNENDNYFLTSAPIA